MSSPAWGNGGQHGGTLITDRSGSPSGLRRTLVMRGPDHLE
jgi:hypothetical protein